MILRAAIVFLVMLNLGIAAWWIGGGNAVRETTTAPMPQGVPGLRLLSEAAAKPAPPLPATAPAPAATAAPAAPAIAIEHCLRFGPFADGTARDAARAALSAAGVAAQPRDTPARSGKGWKVFLPAFATREQAKAMGEKIKAAGIGDWYVMGDGADAPNSIALGRYGSEEAARRREAELKAKGIAAQVVPLGDTAAQSWLDARLPADTRIATLARIAPAKTVECTPAR